MSISNKFDEVETNEGKFLGTRISQDDKTYIARNWKITEEVKKMAKETVQRKEHELAETVDRAKTTLSKIVDDHIEES